MGPKGARFHEFTQSHRERLVSVQSEAAWTWPGSTRVRAPGPAAVAGVKFVRLTPEPQTRPHSWRAGGSGALEGTPSHTSALLRPFAFPNALQS